MARASRCPPPAARARTSAARAEPPAVNVLGVGPEEVAHGALVRHLLLAVDDADLVQRVDGRAQAAVHGEHAVLDDRRQRQVVKHLGAVPPHVDRAVLAQALVVKAVHLRDLPRLVVAADQRHAVREPHLERQQQQKSFHRVEAAVDKVACGARGERGRAGGPGGRARGARARARTATAARLFARIRARRAFAARHALCAPRKR